MDERLTGIAELERRVTVYGPMVGDDNDPLYALLKGEAVQLLSEIAALRAERDTARKEAERLREALRREHAVIGRVHLYCIARTIGLGEWDEIADLVRGINIDPDIRAALAAAPAAPHIATREAERAVIAAARAALSFMPSTADPESYADDGSGSVPWVFPMDGMTAIDGLIDSLQRLAVATYDAAAPAPRAEGGNP